MNTIIRTNEFVAWLDRLKDAKGKARIISRLDMVKLGHFGDCEPIGEGVSEMRIEFGPGYRVYFFRRALQVYVVLGGGDKSTQKRDIKRVKRLARQLSEETKHGKTKN